MSDVLSHEEYSAIAASLVLPSNAFIDGKFQASRSEKSFPTINPATGESLASLPACTVEDVDFAVEKARDWKTGDPLDPSNHLGALIDEEHFNKVSSYLDQGEVMLGGTTEQGCYVYPTIIDGVESSHMLAREEIFGPVLSVITVRSTEEAIAVANDTDYGLAASVFSANGKQALRAAREIRAGTVTVNCYGEGDITTPFGGYKQSGFGGRDNSLHAHDQYTELKTIWIDLSDRMASDAVD